MPRPLRALLTGLAFLAFTLGGAALGWFVLPFTRAGGRTPRAQRRRALEVLFAGHRLFASLLRGLGLLEYRTPALGELPAGPYVLVANHPSLLDVMLLLGTFPGVVCVVKASWFRSPFIAPLLRQAGHIPGPSAEHDDDEGPGAAPVLARIEEALRAGFPVLVFPEGSRSPAGGLRRFRVGALLAARRARVPVVPVVLRVSPPTLLKAQRWYDVPDRRVRYEATLLPSLPPGDEGDVRSHTRALQARYATLLGVPGGGVPSPGGAASQILGPEGRRGAIP